MKQQDTLRHHTTATNRHGSRRGTLGSSHGRGARSRAHRPSAQLITAAVVANYIHDISVRRRRASGPTDRPRDAAHSRPLRHDAEAPAWS